LAIAAIAVLAVVLPGSAVQAAPAAQPQTITWSPCVEDPTAECGTLRVPIDWSRPRGETFDLALARRPATDPAARIGSLVINPGGPGGSGVDFAIFGQGYFTPEITRRFDIVGFDPRGVARSHPVVCSLDVLAQAPSLVVTSQAEFDRYLAYNRRLRQDCRRHTGPLYDHVDTISVVRDLDAIRAALGDRKLTYYGVSYGTLIGQEYAEVFPQRVRALALDSNMDHSLGTKDFMDTETETAQDGFDEFVAWCGRTAGCALHGLDVKAFWADLLARAERGELRDPFDPTIVLTPFDLIGLAFSMQYGPFWFEFAEILAALDAGTPPTATAWTRLAGPKGTAAQPELIENPFEAIFCQDWTLPVRDYAEWARHLRRGARLAPDLGYSVLSLVGPLSCLGTPTPINNPQHRLNVRNANTLLLENSVFDPATAYSWATNAAQQLGRAAVLVTYEGWGHGVYGREACGTSAIDRYLISLALPARGTRCPAVEPTPPGLQVQQSPLPRTDRWRLPSRPRIDMFGVIA
jgi:pimeloyl-ACP methyl ester carboxylesterase